MEHKALIIGGGIAAVFVGGLYLHMRKNASQQSTATVQQSSIPTASPISAQPDLGAYYSGTIPSAVGSSTPTNSANSGSTSTGGGFDISSLLGTFAAGTVTNNASQIIANQHTADSAILAQMPVAPGGSVSVSHTDSGTIVSSTKAVDPNEAGLMGIYQSVLGRAADAGGLAYYESAMSHNPGVSLNDIAVDMKNSAEYKTAHPNG